MTTYLHWRPISKSTFRSYHVLPRPQNPRREAHLDGRRRINLVSNAQLSVLGIAEFSSQHAALICTVVPFQRSGYCRAIQHKALMQALHNTILPTPVGRFTQNPGPTPIPRALRCLSTLFRVARLYSDLMGHVSTIL